MDTIITEKVTNENNVNLHFIQSKKYKTINFVAKFRAPLNRETITMRALLPYVLQQGTKQYPTSRDLQLKLDNLYGAILSLDGAKKGDNHILSIRLEVANQKFIPDESSIIEEAIALLKEIIFHPHIEGSAFHGKTFAREKETLSQKMDAVIDDKMAYANMRLIDEMCEDEAYALHVHGYKEDLDSITAEKAYTYYQTLLEEDELDLYVLGDFDEQEMKELLTSTIKKTSKPIAIEKNAQTNKGERQGEPKEIIEKQNIQQAKLHLGYRTNCTFKDEDYFALQVFNGLLGGFPSSKLFINVREKNSLAYYAASRVESHKGLLLIFSGIASADYEQAREIIELQIAAMKKGDFTTTDLEDTKELITNQFLETLDNTQGIIELLYQQVIGDKKITPNELIDKVKQVTKEEVIKVANKIEEDTVYLLTDKGGDSDE